MSDEANERDAAIYERDVERGHSEMLLAQVEAVSVALGKAQGESAEEAAARVVKERDEARVDLSVVTKGRDAARQGSEMWHQAAIKAGEERDDARAEVAAEREKHAATENRRAATERWAHKADGQATDHASARDAARAEVERLRAITERPAVKHLRGAHLNRRADDCVLCATMDERDQLRAALKSVAERQRLATAKRAAEAIDTGEPFGGLATVVYEAALTTPLVTEGE